MIGSTTRRPWRRTIATVAGTALVAAGLGMGAAPAQAADSVVSGRVVDAQGNPTDGFVDHLPASRPTAASSPYSSAYIGSGYFERTVPTASTSSSTRPSASSRPSSTRTSRAWRGQPGHRRWRRHGAGRLDRGASLRGRHRDRRVRAPDPRHPGLGVRRHERCRGRRRLHRREGRLRAPRRSGPGQGLRVGLRRLRRRVVHRQGQLRDRGRRDRHRGRHAPGDRRSARAARSAASSPATRASRSSRCASRPTAAAT